MSDSCDSSDVEDDDVGKQTVIQQRQRSDDRRRGKEAQELEKRRQLFNQTIKDEDGNEKPKPLERPKRTDGYTNPNSCRPPNGMGLAARMPRGMSGPGYYDPTLSDFPVAKKPTNPPNDSNDGGDDDGDDDGGDGDAKRDREHDAVRGYTTLSEPPKTETSDGSPGQNKEWLVDAACDVEALLAGKAPGSFVFSLERFPTNEQRQNPNFSQLLLCVVDDDGQFGSFSVRRIKLQDDSTMFVLDEFRMVQHESVSGIIARFNANDKLAKTFHEETEFKLIDPYGTIPDGENVVNNCVIPEEVDSDELEEVVAWAQEAEALATQHVLPRGQS
ncbi:hypothetical protein PTSG_08684 [Salpingoeca rosetta]|uniref:Uncharacterized protein n=1 Tax=Salpingoeca rosetta (strain ATCC 50818 / BSB-021) TaxID=946362 RepID=F2UKD8_SALR5|nr:uncharacterized protein PTSG_08684 [Salpingoeca rosetta]EGD77587.1 hypothetical protein PTSG_08684 [Salpingoeca rosetta]|eukprot:XP_004990475.1 hypothetical protein PTSG_08684 [Salpingoeca rosetta]